MKKTMNIKNSKLVKSWNSLISNFQAGACDGFNAPYHDSINNIARNHRMADYKHYRTMRYTTLATATLNIGLAISLLPKFILYEFNWAIICYFLNLVVGITQLMQYLKYKRKSDDLYIDILVDKNPI